MLGGGGGAQKVMCQHAHYERGTELTLAGVQGPLKGPGSSRVVLMLSRAIWASVLSILKKKKNWIEENIVDPILALDPPLLQVYKMCVFRITNLRNNEPHPPARPPAQAPRFPTGQSTPASAYNLYLIA